MLVDFFTYTDATEGGVLSIDEILAAAKAQGLDGVCVVDREHSRHAQTLVEAGQAHGLFVAVGVEIATEDGLAVAFAPQIDQVLLHEEWRRLTTCGRPSLQEVVDYFVGLGGAVVAREVYSEVQPSLGDKVFMVRGLAGVDALSMRRRRIENELALEAVHALGVAGVAGSGAFRSVEGIGTVATVCGIGLSSQEDVVRALDGRELWPVALRPMGSALPLGSVPGERSSGSRDGAGPQGPRRSEGGERRRPERREGPGGRDHDRHGRPPRGHERGGGGRGEGRGGRPPMGRGRPSGGRGR